MAVFDEIAGFYDDWYLTKMGKFVDKVETDLAFDLLRPEKNMKVLDVGCGTGNFSVKLARRGCRVTGVDISPAMLDIARKKAAGEGLGIDFHNMNVCSLDFPGESFDAAFSMAAFEFIEDVSGAVDEMFRVTRKGGLVLIGTINRESRWGELYLSEEYKNSVFRHAFFKAPDDFKNIRKENLIDIRECLFIPPGADESEISADNEMRLSKTERGGFFCALWRK